MFDKSGMGMNGHIQQMYSGKVRTTMAKSNIFIWWFRRSFIIETVLLSNIFLEIKCHNNSTDTCSLQKPNIIFILADDAGWNDFSFHGSPQIPTPNIDALAFSGTVLNRYYGSPLCTPTRAAIMTGKHPIHLGLQHYVILAQSTKGLPLNEKLLPQYLKDLGYTSHMVGKWHLGHARQVYTPTKRGFDSHFGYYLGKQDYYDHTHLDGTKVGWGYDFRSNLSLNFDVFGTYCTDLITDESIRLIKSHPKDKPLFLMINHIAPHSGNAYDPLQAPAHVVDRFKDTIADKNRRVYAAMVAGVDDSIGKVVAALSETGLLKNSIIVFASDNGGAPNGYDLNYGSNWPLRGVKNTLWEGGTRLAGLIWGSSLISNRVSNDVFHAEDWLPTLFEAAGGKTSDLGNIDGKSVWGSLTAGEPSPVETFLYNIDDIYNNSAIFHNGWKLIQGNTSTKDLGGGNWDGWYGPSGTRVHDLIPSILQSQTAIILRSLGITLNASSVRRLQREAKVQCNDSLEPIRCNPYKGPCLFDLNTDPCEKRNLADEYPEVVKDLLALLDGYNKTSVPPIPRIKDPDGIAYKWGYIWTTWKDFLDPEPNTLE